MSNVLVKIVSDGAHQENLPNVLLMSIVSVLQVAQKRGVIQRNMVLWKADQPKEEMDRVCHLK